MMEWFNGYLDNLLTQYGSNAADYCRYVVILACVGLAIVAVIDAGMLVVVLVAADVIGVFGTYATFYLDHGYAPIAVYVAWAIIAIANVFAIKAHKESVKR